LFSREQIATALLDPETPRIWITHPVGDAIKKEIESYAPKHRLCPHGLGNAYIPKEPNGAPQNAPCAGCPCLLGTDEDGNVHCTGTSNITSLGTLAIARTGTLVEQPEFLATHIHQKREWTRQREEYLSRRNNIAGRAAASPSPFLPRAERTQSIFRRPRPTIPISEIADTSKILDSGKRFCLTCQRPMTGYAGKGKYAGRTVWLCSQPRHAGMVD
jgi:hypothetical protein